MIGFGSVDKVYFYGVLLRLIVHWRVSDVHSAMMLTLGKITDC